MKILVFIPTFNEAGNIKILLESINKIDFNFDLLIIDDSSSDGTYDEAKKTNLENLTIIKRKFKSGIGSAHRDAIKYAVSNHYTNLITMDGDGTHRSADLSRLFHKIELCNDDVIIGSRFIKPNSINNWPRSRVILSHLGHLVTKFGLGINFDCSSGFRAYKLNQQILDITNSLQATGYDFFFKSIFKFKEARLKISEIDIVLEPRGSGNSKMTIGLAIYSISKLISTIIKFRFSNLKIVGNAK